MSELKNKDYQEQKGKISSSSGVLKLIKDFLIYFSKTTVGLLLLWFPAIVFTMGMFGGAYGLNYLISTITNTQLELNLELYSLFIGVFVGSRLTIIWVIFVFSKMKACFNDDHKERKTKK